MAKKAKKEKYRFNPHLITYEKVSTTLKDKLIKIFYYIAGVSVFSTVVILIAYNTIDSPKEKILKREIGQYQLQYEILNERLTVISNVLDDIQNRDDNIYRVIFEAEPISSSIRKAGYGGVDRYAKLEGYNNSELIIETTKKIDKVSRQLYVQSKSFDEVFEMVKNKTKMLACIPAIQPILKGRGQIASGFGYRYHPVYKTLRMHTGIDIVTKPGVPIYATGDGIVSTPDKGLSGYGIVCVINHGYGYQTLYGHMRKITVRVGQRVKRGQIIGYVGSTGLSIGPHLHYEVIKNGNKINPVHYFYNDLTPEEYEQVIEISSRVNQSLS